MHIYHSKTKQMNTEYIPVKNRMMEPTFGVFGNKIKELNTLYLAIK